PFVFDKNGWQVRGGLDASDQGADTDQAHFRYLLECIKEAKPPNGEIGEGHKSTRLCHLGNIALRVGRVLLFDDKTETISGDPEANELLGRIYRKPFEVPEKA